MHFFACIQSLADKKFSEWSSWKWTNSELQPFRNVKIYMKKMSKFQYKSPWFSWHSIATIVQAKMLLQNCSMCSILLMLKHSCTLNWMKCLELKESNWMLIPFHYGGALKHKALSYERRANESRNTRCFYRKLAKLAAEYHGKVMLWSAPKHFEFQTVIVVRRLTCYYQFN